jgi:putative tryptophan/tyrosine transport system substrate-binding protein
MKQPIEAVGRRAAIAGLAMSMIAAGAHAQGAAAARPRRIALLGSTDAESSEDTLHRLELQLKALGYRPGRDLVFEARYAHRDPRRLPELARELVATRPDLLIALEPALSALKQATSSIPIVMLGGLNPVETGLVASLARPGGNVTGATFSQPELGAKRFAVLKAAAPRIRRVAYFQNPAVPGMLGYRPEAEKIARALGIELHYVDVTRAGEFRPEVLERLRADALYVTYDYAVGSVTRQLAQFAREHRLPSIGVMPEFVALGGLMWFGPDLSELDAVVAGYVDRILRGGSPADMAIWMPSRFRLVVSRGTAAAIGLPLSPEFLLRVDEIVD